MPSFHVLILAAGQGKRMHSGAPKLLLPCAGLPLLEHVVRAACRLDVDSVHLVVAPDDEGIREALTSHPVEFAVQESPTGTADAIAAGCAAIVADAGTLLVINGDCPGVRTSTLEYLVRQRGDAAGALLAVAPDDRRGYGRLLLDDSGAFLGIVEEADADEEQLATPWVNGGVYCFDLRQLRGVFGSIDADNSQSERYATALFAALPPGSVRAVPYGDADEVHGVNRRSELARAEALLRRRTLDRLMDSGTTVRDPEATYVDVDVEVGADSVLYPGVVLEGNTVIGRGCRVLSRVRITRSRIGDDVTVLDGSIIEDSSVDDGASVGPYARLRPGSEIGRAAKVGNFVETKATRLGAGSKAGHLTYLGNARIGENVNIGAGTITCNYDGVDKHETIIEDGAFIGSNTALVAPVRVGSNAYVGAGSTITEDVPDDALGVGRGRQVNKDGWANKKDQG